MNTRASQQPTLWAPGAASPPPATEPIRVPITLVPDGYRLTEAVWRDVLEHVRQHTRDVFAGWFSQLTPGDLQQGELVIHAHNAAQLRYLDELARQAFTDAIQTVTGRLVAVRFALIYGTAQPASAALATPTTGVENGEQRAPASLMTRVQAAENWSAAELPLNAEYTFEQFVVGPCNRLAHAAAIAVSESPGKAYNPLFIHGSVGLGKTHLLQAACHTVRRDRPESRILFLSCESFINHFIEAVEAGLLHQFRYRYRHVDLLVIDDIQFLGKRERSQEEFFHTFNTLYQLQKQIIISADAPPSEIPSLEDRLVSRFNWGLVARIEEPCFETRIAILRKKSSLRGVKLADDVLAFIADRVVSNTRELEGAINRVLGLALLSPERTVTLETAKAALGDGEGGPVQAREITIQDIIDIVPKHFGLKASDMQGKRRSKSVSYPRQICMYLARTLTRMSLEEIGGYFGGRDHTTVLHAHRTIDTARQSNPELANLLEKLRLQLRDGNPGSG